MKKIRVLLADDHTVMRIGLISLISREKDMTVVGEAETGEEAVRLADELKPDIVIMDLMMPKLSGAEATRFITAPAPHPHVLIFTSYGTSVDLARAAMNGADGAMLKNAPTGELIAAIRKICNGERVLSDDIAALVAETTETADLTERQLKILDLAARGFTNQDIANQLNISLIGVKKQFSTIFTRLHVANRAEAIAIAIQKQLVR